MSSIVKRPPWWLPALVVGIVLVGYLGWAYTAAHGDPARIFHVGNPHQGTGYDGQFVYAMAQELAPQRIAPALDVPAYRYQRILLPLLAHPFARTPQGILWSVWLISAAVHLMAVGVWGAWMQRWGVSPWWAMLYGLWPGILLPLRIGMPEPLAYGLATLALWWFERERLAAAALMIVGALFAKELALPFALAMAAALFARNRARGLRWGIAVFAPWGAWQLWLWYTFGQPALRFGGLGADPPPPIPFGGLLQVALTLPLWWFAIYLTVFGPSLLLPIGASIKWWWQRRRATRDVWTWLLGFHLLASAAVPMLSWEPFAIFRVLTGMMMAFWGVSFQEKRLTLLQRLTPFWWGLLAFALAR